MNNEGFAYSGRGMFGRHCFAIKGLENLLTAIREDPDLPTAGWESDALGKDTVYYHQGVPPPDDRN